MPEEIKTPNETKEKNTVALIGMICSILGLLLLLTIIGIGFGFILLMIGFILGIIGLFYKPRGKARVAVLIPGIIRTCLLIGFLYIKNSIKAPASEFTTRIETISENDTYNNILEDDDFGNAISNEFKEIITSKDKNEFMELYNTSSGSNTIEKWSYVFFGLMRESIENSLEKYGIDTENIDEEDTEDEEIDEENTDEEETLEEDTNENIDEEDTEDEETDNESENKEQNTKKAKTESVEIFNNGEKNDIEEIINILE